MSYTLSPQIIENSNDSQELVTAREQRAQFDRNSRYLQSRIAEVYTLHRGKFICVAGGRLFVADTAKEAIAQALAAEPNELGWFTRYIPVEKVPRVYAM
jgi:hypothetical protein